ncbi:ATPase domain-containing protein [Zavarzinella formosa]|uniref:ATPase domain-containing protein n=1 Tax=Zavarzinella formosa TaxID=360055 RepID=UPI000301DD48|nr:ATPase domain-containing protein [Zavarzinella formosa]
MNPRSDERIPTGVPGLDYVLLGGFVSEGFYLVQGDPGSGKTTVALQYVLGRLAAGESSLYITLTESRRDLENACASHGWSLDGIEICDLTLSAANLSGEPESSVFHPSETELGETTKAIFAAVDKAKPKHVVFDGLSEMRLLAGNPLIYRRQLLALKEFFAARHATVLLLDDRSSPFGSVLPESLVGGNIVLERTLPQYGRARRRMYVTKVRGSNFREGFHDYEIIQGGVVVHPRLVAAEHHEKFVRKLRPSGLANLDTMLFGGLTTGSTTLMLGPAGVGKSTITMQFCVTAMQAGDKVAVYMFDEVLDTLVERVEKLCLGKEGGLRAFMTEGMLHAQQVDPAEMTPGAFAHEVRRAVEAGAKVIVIDSLNGYLNAMPEERFLTTHLHELFSYLNQKGVTTLMVVAQHGMIVGGGGMAGDVDVSYLADTVLLFRYFEARGEIKQAISVFKKRTGEHERTLRQMTISSKGVTIGEPLREFRGVMTGVPQYEGLTSPIREQPKAEGASAS